MTIPIEDLMGENQPVFINPSPGDDETFDIMEGEGVGDYGGAPLASAFEDLAEDQGLPTGRSFWSKIFGAFGSVSGASSYIESGGLVIDLTKYDYLKPGDGRIQNRSQAIGELIDRLGISYDEAKRIVDGWDDRPGGELDGELLGDLNDELDDFADGRGDGGGGGGGGYRAPAKQYLGPDRGLVEDWVKSRLVTLVGKADDDRIKMLADKYYDADRKNFNIVKGEAIDAKQTVNETIREFDDYKRIHTNRTDMQDEDTWITGQMSELLGAGVSGQEAEKLAINFAQAGVAKVRAGELSEARRVGSAPTDALPGFFNKVQSAMSTVARSMR